MSFHVARWEGLVTAPGIYLGTPEERYHDDPCPEPSLSATVAKIAFEKCLSKARAKHPRLRLPDYPEDEEEEDRNPPWYVDVGSAVHSLALRSGQEVVHVAVKDWRSKDAQRIRAEYRNARCVPLKTKHYDVAQRMATRLQPFLFNLLGTDFAAEAMACSQHGDYGWWLRSLLDGASTDLRVLADVKTTSLDVSPRAAGRTVNRNGNQFQSSFYVKNLDQLDPAGMGRRKFHFVFQEVEYPHEISIVHPDPALMSLGDDQVEASMRLWDRAMKSGEFPGYPQASQSVGPENWAMRELQERLMMDEELQPDAT